MSGGPEKQSDNVNIFGIVVVGIATTVIMWGGVVLLQGYYQSTAQEVEAAHASANKGNEMNTLKAAQVASLQEYRWVNQNKGMVAISLDAAKTLVVDEAKRGNASLVPAIGLHDTPTVPASPGRPVDGVSVTPAPTTPAGAPPAAAPATPTSATPGATTPGAATPGAAPTAAPAGATAPTAPAPTAPAPVTAPVTPARTPASGTKATPAKKSGGAAPAAPTSPKKPATP